MSFITPELIRAVQEERLSVARERHRARNPATPVPVLGRVLAVLTPRLRPLTRPSRPSREDTAPRNA